MRGETAQTGRSAMRYARTPIWGLMAGAACLLGAFGGPAGVMANGDAANCTPSTCAQPFLEGGLYGIRNASGEVVIAPRFDKAYLATARYPGYPANGLIITEKGDKLGFVNRQGTETFAPSFDRGVGAPQRGYINVERGGKKCLVDGSGRLAVACEHELIFHTSVPGQFVVINNKQPQTIDLSGRVIPPVTQTRTAAAPAARPATPIITAPRSRAMQYADARRWEDAVRTALTSTSRDKADLLLAMSAMAYDTQVDPGEMLVFRNMAMFNDAIAVALPHEKSTLVKMKQAYEDYGRRQNAAAQPPPRPGGWRPAPSATPAPSVKTYEPRRCYRVSKEREVCYN